MAFDIKLEAVTASGHGIIQGDDYSVFLDESVTGNVLPTDLLVAKITNFTAGPAGSTFRFATAGTTTYDGGGRFKLVQVGNDWYLAIKNGALFDYEDLPIISEVSIQRVNGSTLIDEGTFDFYLNDVDEGSADAAPTVSGLGTVNADANSGTVQPFGSVVIGNDAGQATTATISFTSNLGTLSGAGTGTVSNGIITYTVSGTDAADLQAKLRAVTFNPRDLAAGQSEDISLTLSITDPGHATGTTGTATVHSVAANHAPPDPTAAATINERSGDGTPVLTMAEFDEDGQRIIYIFAVPKANTGGKVSLDGKFRIDGNEIVVNAPDGTTLSEVAQDTTLPNYAIVANDGTGAPNGTVTGNVSITVKNVPLLSIAAVTTGPVPEGDTGTVDYVFHVTRDSTGSESTFTWTVSGTGINADDFEVLSDTITFGATDTFKDIVLKVKADRVAELNENFTVTLSELQGADINPGQGSATGSITDDDNAPSFEILDGQETHSGNVGDVIVDVLKGVDIEDLDGDDLTLTVSFRNVNGTLNGMETGGGVQVTDNGTDGNGIRKFILVGSAAAIENLLAAVTFTATAAGQTDFSFTLTDTFNPVKTFTNAVNVVGTIADNPPPPTPSGTHTVHEGKGGGFVVKELPLQDGGVDIDYTFEAAMDNTGGKVSADGRYEIVDNEIRVRGAGWVSIPSDFTDTYRIRATDGVTPVFGDVTIIVKNNVGPTINAVAASGSGQDGAANTIVVSENAGAVEIGTVTASDPDADLDGRTLSYSLADTHDGLFTIDAVTGKIRIANADLLPVGVDTPYQLTIRVSDGSDVTTETVTVIVKDVPVNPPNNAPANLQLSNASVLEYDPVGKEVGTFSATDANNDALTYTLLDNAGGRFAISGNKLVLAGPGVNYEDAKSHQIKVQVSDGKGGVIDQVFTISVGDQLTLNKRGTKKADKLNGSALDDILKGGTGNAKDTIKGLAGDDQLFGEGGDDKLFGGDGIDSLFGGKGNDTLKGEAGKDLLKGEVGNDKLYGGLGNDVLYGGKGNDLLKGDADDDVLYGEEGNDKLTGGAGNDTFVFNKKASKANFDTITDFKSGQDKLFLDNAVFKKLGTTGTFDAPAKLDVSMFRTNKAKDKNDYLVYKGGVLYYDANGSAKGGEVEIAKLKGLKVTDIWVI